MILSIHRISNKDGSVSFWIDPNRSTEEVINCLNILENTAIEFPGYLVEYLGQAVEDKVAKDIDSFLAGG